MTRPKAPKDRRAGGTPRAAAAAGPATAAPQQQQQQPPAAQQQQVAAKIRPAEAAGALPAGSGLAAATAAAAGGEQPEVDQLERKRMQVAEELRQVEKQIFDLESNYFQISSAMGNAIRGYEGFLGGSKKSAAAPVQPEERLFSWSSITGQLGCGAPTE